MRKDVVFLGQQMVIDPDRQLSPAIWLPPKVTRDITHGSKPKRELDRPRQSVPGKKDESLGHLTSAWPTGFSNLLIIRPRGCRCEEAPARRRRTADTLAERPGRSADANLTADLSLRHQTTSQSSQPLRDPRPLLRGMADPTDPFPWDLSIDRGRAFPWISFLSLTDANKLELSIISAHQRPRRACPTTSGLFRGNQRNSGQSPSPAPGDYICLSISEQRGQGKPCAVRWNPSYHKGWGVAGLGLSSRSTALAETARRPAHPGEPTGRPAPPRTSDTRRHGPLRAMARRRNRR